MTRRGAAVLTGAIILAGVGRLLGVSELYVVAAAAGVLVAAGFLAVRTSSASVAVRRTLPSSRLLVGGTGEVVLELKNEARLEATLLLVEDNCPVSLAEPARFVVGGLRPGRTVALRYPLAPTARGRHRVGPLTVRIRDPFGMAEKVRRYQTTSELIVYPRVEALSAESTRGAHRGTGSSDTRRVFAAGDEFYTMREYVQGDDLRQVHWPSTAHRQTLMIRQQEMPWQAQATIFCDTRESAHVGVGATSTLERGVSAAASALWHLADRRYSLRLATEETARAPMVEPWNALLDRLALVEPSRVRGLSPALGALRAGGGEGLLVAVLAPPTTEDLMASPDVRALLRAGRGYGGRIALVVVDPGRVQSAVRGGALVNLLRANRWQAATLGNEQPLAEPWSSLAAPRPRAWKAGQGASATPAATAIPTATRGA